MLNFYSLIVMKRFQLHIREDWIKISLQRSQLFIYKLIKLEGKEERKGDDIGRLSKQKQKFGS